MSRFPTWLRRPSLGMWTHLRGRLKQWAGRASGNRLLEFEGGQDCLQARIALRTARDRGDSTQQPALSFIRR